MTMFYSNILGPIDLSNNLKLEKIARLVQGVPRDTYIEDGSRYKSIARVTVSENGTIVRQEHGPLYQSPEANELQGGLEREYPEMEAELLKELEPAILVFNQLASAFTSGREILVQAQRVEVGPSDPIGNPNPQSWHTDDTEQLGLLCIERNNIVGAENLFATTASNPAHYGCILDAGHLMLVSDRAMLHEVTQMYRADPNKRASRSIAIFSVPSCRVPS